MNEVLVHIRQFLTIRSLFDIRSSYWIRLVVNHPIERLLYVKYMQSMAYSLR